MKTLVVGYGNSWRGDDGVGAAAAERIEALRLPGVAALSVHQLLPELAEALADYQRVVFIDAACDVAPAEVRWTPVESDTAGIESHVWSPAAILALCDILYDRRPSAWLLTIGVKEFEPGAAFSAAALEGLAQALKLLGDFLASDAPHPPLLPVSTTRSAGA
jgi:hydrogenase maturation protease